MKPKSHGIPVAAMYVAILGNSTYYIVHTYILYYACQCTLSKLLGYKLDSFVCLIMGRYIVNGMYAMEIGHNMYVC